jgi:hypothetical protein
MHNSGVYLSIKSTAHFGLAAKLNEKRETTMVQLLKATLMTALIIRQSEEYQLRIAIQNV